MDHNGLYSDLDSFTSITNCGTTNNSFNDTCTTLPSLNNFKYHQTNLSTNIYQQPVQTIHDQPSGHTPKASTLPQTQININNCNNNIFFPHDDGIFDANTATACASTTNPNSGGNKNNFIGYVRKESGASGGGGDNITYNINNINTNIVNNINNPTNTLVNGNDIFGANQYHQINKNGETIINFTNNNLNSTGTGSMPADTVSATSQNYYGYQANNAQGQSTVYETSVQSQSQSSTFLDPSKSSMGTTGAGLFHGHHHSQSSLNQTLTNNGSYHHSGNASATDHSAPSVDPFSEYSEPLSTAKIINNFESKNPLKYPTSNRPAPSYYKAPPQDFPAHQFLPPHNYPGLYQGANGMPAAMQKIPSHNYEHYPRIPRNTVPHYPAQHYPQPPNAHSLDEHNASRLNYNRPTGVPVPPYHHPHTMPPHPSTNYGNFYSNGYGAMPYTAYPGPPYVNPLLRNENCSKPSTNYSKTGAVALSPVDHNNFSMSHGSSYAPPKKDFFSENLYFPPAHPYYEDQVLTSCSKKSSSRPKTNVDMYNPNGATTIYPEHHQMQHHHPQNGNVMRTASYQPMPKHYAPSNPYQMPQTNSCELANPYHNYNYHYKNGEHPKMQKINPAMSTKQFKSFYDPMPPHPYAHQPQYPMMQAKHPEKIKISIDLEEQINSSKIPKLPHPSYGFDPHHPHHYYQYHHPMPPRNDNDPSKNQIAGINISLRDFLSTWSEIDDDEESGERRPTAIEDHMERSIMREYNPMFVQKAIADSFVDVPIANKPSHLSELESSSEKLYVLESIDVPLSELNKYKHLSVINKLPENVVINDKELYADDGSMKFIEEIDLTREKLYKSEFELEFEACQERKISKPIDELPPPAKVVEKVVIESVEVIAEAPPVVEIPRKSDSDEKPEKSSPKKKALKVKAPKLKSFEAKVPKVKQNILKLKKEKIMKVRSTKRAKKYSLNQRTSSIKTLQSICVDFLNTSGYRNYAREQLSIINKHSKRRILQDFKKKFNFDGMKRANTAINQKFNHSDLRINSLREICGKLLKDKSRMLEINSDEESEDVTVMQCETFDEDENDDGDCLTLKELCKATLTQMDINVVENDYIYTPPSLKELCETFIYSNNQYFVFEEFSSVPKLQDLCKNVLSETNIFINLDGEANEIFSLGEAPVEVEADVEAEVESEEPIYIVEENSGNVGELFESDNLNSFEKSEILRKIQRVANIEDDDDEIFRAIDELHRDDDDDESIINNNNCNVSNRNISGVNEISSEPNEFSETKFESEMSFVSFMEDDLVYEEIVTGNARLDNSKILEILRHKYLNRADVRQASKTINAILKKSLFYQRAQRFRNVARRTKINALRQQARAALWRLKEAENCDNDGDIQRSSTPQRESVHESQHNAKDETQAQSHQKLIYQQSDDDSSSDNSFDSQAEHNLPKLPSVFPSINEYKIDRKSSNRSDVKDIFDSKHRKLNFDESLLSIDKMYGRENVGNCEENSSQNHQTGERRHSSQSHHRSSHNHRSSSDRYHDSSRRHHSSRNGHHRSHRSRSHDRDRNSYHNSSRHNFYKRDQMKHSEAKRLVIPSYKIYDKDLDYKLKIMPFVRIEREERVDELVKKYN